MRRMDADGTNATSFGDPYFAKAQSTKPNTSIGGVSSRPFTKFTDEV